MNRVILHLDMDAFYAAVEVREDPSLAGQPLIIGHRGRRGVVSTCSYEARTFGVRSAMPSIIAERLCPDAIWLPGRMSLYVEVSRRILGILREASPIVEPLSIDEAFLDASGIAADLEEGAGIGRRLKERIRAEERLTGSVGVASNKFLAKLASDLEKPDGLVVFSSEDVPRRMWSMPVGRLWGVGPKMQRRLENGGLRTVGDVARCAPRALGALVGPGMAAHLLDLSHGRDERPVESSRETKSISEERTYGEDLTDAAEIDRALLARSEGVAREMRREGLVGRTIHLKVRTGDFTTWTRSLTLGAPTDLPEPIVAAAREMFRTRIDLAGNGVRLLGVGMSGLEPAGRSQRALFSEPEDERSRRLAAAGDAVRDRLGEDALVRARLLRRKKKHDEGEASSLPSID